MLPSRSPISVRASGRRSAAVQVPFFSPPGRKLSSHRLAADLPETFQRRICEISLRADTVFIISIAQHARPNVAGQRLDLLAQLTIASSLTVTTSGSDSKTLFSKPIFRPKLSSTNFNSRSRFSFRSHSFDLCPGFGPCLQSPIEGAFFPNVYVSDHERCHKDNDLDQSTVPKVYR